MHGFSKVQNVLNLSSDALYALHLLLCITVVCCACCMAYMPGMYIKEVLYVLGSFAAFSAPYALTMLIAGCCCSSHGISPDHEELRGYGSGQQQRYGITLHPADYALPAYAQRQPQTPACAA